MLQVYDEAFGDSSDATLKTKMNTMMMTNDIEKMMMNKKMKKMIMKNKTQWKGTNKNNNDNNNNVMTTKKD